MGKFPGLGVVVGWMAIGMLALGAGPRLVGDEPPAVNPFGDTQASRRDDALPGYVELSTGKIIAGQVYLTREARLRISDEQVKKFRDVPLRVVRRIDCTVTRAWVEREWRFKENANDAKVYTGRSYPAREYVHVMTLDDGTTIRGPLSAIVYVRPAATPATKPGGRPPEPIRFLLHQRDKGNVGTRLDSLVYVKAVVLGEEALAEARQRAANATGQPATPRKKAADGTRAPARGPSR